MENLLTGLPGWLLVLLASGYIIRVERRDKNDNSSPNKREVRELISEMRVFVQHMRTWTALNEDRSKRMETILNTLKERSG